jgi:DNA polymerase III subunit epsilon
MSKFVAIDFELANRNFLSACAIGIVVVEDGVITFEKGYLIKPPLDYDYFIDEFIAIHQIQPQDVVHAMDFSQIYLMIYPYLDDATLIAHNAEFDIGILRELAQYYRLKLPNSYYVCTVRLARRLIKDLSNYKLNTVARYLNVALDHHQAHSDAKACCQIALYGLATNGVEDILALCLKINVRYRKILL